MQDKIKEYKAIYNDCYEDLRELLFILKNNGYSYYNISYILGISYDNCYNLMNKTKDIKIEKIENYYNRAAAEIETLKKKYSNFIDNI